MTREYAKVTVKSATPSQTHKGLFTCPATWLPERTYDLAEFLGLIDSSGMVLITAEWADNTHHARSICDSNGAEHRIPDDCKTTY